MKVLTKFAHRKFYIEEKLLALLDKALKEKFDKCNTFPNFYQNRSIYFRHIVCEFFKDNGINSSEFTDVDLTDQLDLLLGKLYEEDKTRLECENRNAWMTVKIWECIKDKKAFS